VGRAWKVIGIVALAAVLGSGSVAVAPRASAEQSFSHLSPRQILAAAVNAANGARTARVVSVSKTKSQTSIYSNDSAEQSGRQTIQSGPAVTNILVTSDRTAYIEGNPQGLAQSFGISGAIAGRLSDTWFSMRPGDPGYSEIEVGVTLPSVLWEFSPQTSLTKTKIRTVDGQKVIGVSGKQTIQGQRGIITLYIAVNGSHLPVASSGRSGNETSSATFSNWTETVDVTAPPNPVPISSIFPGGSGSGGVVTASLRTSQPAVIA
jgi:hypothetical protein